MKKEKEKISQPILTKRPKVGQIIFGEEEFIIGRKKENSNIIEVGLKKEQCIVKEKIYEKIISKGFVFEVPKTIEKDLSVIDESRSNSVWVVVEVEHKKRLYLIYSSIPESYRVVCKRLINNKITEESETIEFYTCGSKKIYQNIINKKFEVIGTMNIE